MNTIIEKIKEQLQIKIHPLHTANWNAAIREAIETVDYAAETYNNWILCSERLPEEEDDLYPMCIVSLDNGAVCLGVYRYDGEEWWTRLNEGETRYSTNHKVVAWQPLPEPYEKGES